MFQRMTVIIIGVAVAGCGGDREPRRVVAEAAAAPATASADGGVLVDVAGFVRRPGVYRLPPGARVHHAIAAAGGARSGADLATLNRAAPLVDGQQVLVARRGAGGTESANADSSAKVSINTADVAALDALPGIGPVTAQHIVDERTNSGPFASIDDLDRVSGIGPATIESIRDVATT